MLALVGVVVGSLGTLAASFLLQRSKRQDDLRQWQRDEMLRAVADFVQAHTDAQRVAAGDTGRIEFTDAATLRAHAQAHRVARNDAAARIARIELLYGPESATATAAYDLLRAHDTLSRALEDGIEPPAQDDQDRGALEANLALAFDGLNAPRAALYDAARKDIADPTPLAPSVRRTVRDRLKGKWIT